MKHLFYDEVYKPALIIIWNIVQYYEHLSINIQYSRLKLSELVMNANQDLLYK